MTEHKKALFIFLLTVFFTVLTFLLVPKEFVILHTFGALVVFIIGSVIAIMQLRPKERTPFGVLLMILHDIIFFDFSRSEILKFLEIKYKIPQWVFLVAICLAFVGVAYLFSLTHSRDSTSSQNPATAPLPSTERIY